MKSKLTIEFAANDTLEWPHPVCAKEEKKTRLVSQAK